MIVISLKKSPSKNYKDAINLLLEFDKSVQDEISFAEISVKEIFEKWDTFNKLFWTTVDWKGMTLTFDNMTYHSHTDKTRIFYALQNSRWKWLSFVESRIQNIDQVYTKKIDLKNISTESMTEEEINDFLDKMNDFKWRD